MKKIFQFQILSFAALMLSMVACTAPVTQESVDESLQYAEALLERGSFEAALDGVKSIADSAKFEKLTITQLGRLSMIYMQVSENMDQASNLVVATDIFDYAYRVNADSAAMFYGSVEPDQMQYVETMRHSSASRRMPMDVTSIPEDIYIECDSLYLIEQLPNPTDSL